MKRYGSTAIIVLLSVIGVLVLTTVIFVVMGISYNNHEVRLRNQFNAVLENNKNEFDLMWKKIAKIAQVTKAERASVEKIIIEYAGARTGGGGLVGKGSFINAVHEALPNISDTAFVNLQNIIVASHDRFAANQTKLIDIKREHDNIRLTFPSSLICGGREELKLIIVTSDKTEEAFETGKDNDTDLDL